MAGDAAAAAAPPITSVVEEDANVGPRMVSLEHSDSIATRRPDVLEHQREKKREKEKREADATSPITAAMSAMFAGTNDADAAAATAIPGLALALEEDEDEDGASASERGGDTPKTPKLDAASGRLTVNEGDENAAGGGGEKTSASATSERNNDDDDKKSGAPHLHRPPPVVETIKPTKLPWRWHQSRRRLEEGDNDVKWLARRKHFFVLSDAGKPIYSRYGDESALAGFTAALAAIVSVAEEPGGGGDKGDKLHSVSAGQGRVYVPFIHHV